MLKSLEKNKSWEYNIENEKNRSKIILCLNKVKRQKNQKKSYEIICHRVREDYEIDCDLKKKKIFDYYQLKFFIDRRSRHYRRILVTKDTLKFANWIQKFSDMLRSLIETNDERKKITLLFEIWRNIFVKDVRNMSITDLIEHQISTYSSCVSVAAKSILYSAEKIKWQKNNLSTLMKIEIITLCQFFWSTRTRFLRKTNDIFRIIYVFC